MCKTKTTVAIDGMSCRHCVMTVREALERVEGIEVQSVEIGTAVVFSDGSVETHNALRDSIEDVGFEVREVTA